MTLGELRQALPAARAHHFLNYAATAPVLQPSADAMADIARQGTEPMNRHFNAWLALLESARRSVADTIGASPEEIAFTTNTSTALSLVAGAIHWRRGDRVLFPADEFPSNRFVWQNLAEFGVCAEEIEPEPGIEFAEQLARRNLDGVRLVALSAVAYRDGRHANVAAVARLCRARGILVAVDGIQAVGAVPVDVRQWGCDFFACGGQKWLLSPVGTGFLYIAVNRLPELHVPQVGWASSRAAGDFGVKTLEFCDGARRFEPGLPDIAAIAGLGKSLELFAAAGWRNVFERVADLNTRLRTELTRLGYTLLYDGPTQAGIVTIELPTDAAAETVAATCEQRNILVTHRRRLLRFAAHATTSDDDIAVLIETLGGKRSTVNPPAARAVSSAAKPQWRRALVTGASRGLGEGIALALARRGCAVTLVGRDSAALAAVAERLQSQCGVQAEVVVLDLSDRAALSRQQHRWAEVDVLVNNAANAEAGLFAANDLDRLRTDFEVNFFAPVTLTHAVLPGMLERRGGAIMNIVTSGARCALPLFADYAATKGALWAWSEALSHELVDSGVTVSTFLPPHMATNTQQRLGRVALGYYRVVGGEPRLASPLVVGEQAVTALAAGRRTVVPWRVRLKLAANAVSPAWLARRIQRVWRQKDSG